MLQNAMIEGLIDKNECEGAKQTIFNWGPNFQWQKGMDGLRQAHAIRQVVQEWVQCVLQVGGGGGGGGVCFCVCVCVFVCVCISFFHSKKNGILSSRKKYTEYMTKCQCVYVPHK